MSCSPSPSALSDDGHDHLLYDSNSVFDFSSTACSQQWVKSVSHSPHLVLDFLGVLLEKEFVVYSYSKYMTLVLNGVSSTLIIMMMSSLLLLEGAWLCFFLG